MKSDLSGSELSTILDVIADDAGTEAADDQLGKWSFPFEVAELSRRYRAYPEVMHDASLVAWIVAGHGLDDPSEFEAELGRRLGFGTLSAPVWVLSRPVPSIGTRLPADPFVCPLEPDIETAYRELVAHLETYDHTAARELQRSAIVWRVGALVDGMEPLDEDSDDKRPLGRRLDQIIFRMRRDGRLTAEEDALCSGWATRDFGDRRNALTHLGGRAISFAAACAHYVERTVLMTECAAISLAVLQQSALVMREQPPPIGLLSRAASSVEWMDD